jgi:hypothetical protein
VHDADRAQWMTKAPAPPEAPDATVVVLFAAFLEWAQKPATYQWHRNYLHNFIKTIPPDLRVAELKPFHVTSWLDEQDG